MLFQDDIDVACGAEDSDFHPVLKPYQLVGVNFLLLLYRKGIGGGISSNFVFIYIYICIKDMALSYFCP